MEKMSSKDANNHKLVGIAELMKQGKDAEIYELDRSGNVQRRWLHQPDNIASSVCFAPPAPTGLCIHC
jgi:hypothetical protein